MAREIERKFLVRRPPGWLEDCRSEAIDQGYLAIADNGDEVRVRHHDSATVLTVKRGRGKERIEVEIEIDGRQFDALWPLTEGRRVRKRRYYVGDEVKVEVDVYAEPLAGLVTAEVEFESIEAADAFSPPDWLDDELTGDDRYTNQQLAVRGRPGE